MNKITTSASYYTSTAIQANQQAQTIELPTDNYLKADTVTLSHAGQRINETPAPLPSVHPKLANILKYQAVAGLGDGKVSGVEAYAIKHNDTARSMYVGHKQLSQQAKLADIWLESLAPTEAS